MRVRLSPETRDGACFLCGKQGAILSFFFQVGEALVASSHDVCFPCFTNHQMVIELEELETTPRKRTPKVNKKASMRQENKLAQAIDGVRHKGSGSLPWAKGDVRKKGELRGEAKTTRAQGYRITRAELDKIRAECDCDETPFMSLWFCGTNWKPEDKWVLVPEAVWRRLRDGG